jgi:hypothetical protein
MHLCSFRSEPAERECLEAIWSVGRPGGRDGADVSEADR